MCVSFGSNLLNNICSDWKQCLNPRSWPEKHKATRLNKRRCGDGGAGKYMGPPVIGAGPPKVADVAGSWSTVADPAGGGTVVMNGAAMAGAGCAETSNGF